MRPRSYSRRHADDESQHVLNPLLYNAIRSRLGDVEVSSPGVAALAGRPTRSRKFGDYETQFIHKGEYYTVNCPFCDDIHKRLYIHHQFNYPDPLNGRPMRHLAVCYNEGCLQHHFSDFMDKLFGWINADTLEVARQMRLREGVKPIASEILLEVELPGHIAPLSELDRMHPAIRYLRGRWLDIGELADEWDLGFCGRSSLFPRASNRIISTAVQEGKVVGWQGRWPDDINWKAADIPKYYTLPGMPKSRILYNFDRAIKRRTVVVTEGVVDAWAVGDEGVSVFGKTISPIQLKLLSRWSEDRGFLVLLLDPGAWTDEVKDDKARAKAAIRHAQLKTQLSRMFGKRFIEVTLPRGRDAGKYHRDALWRIIAEQAAAQGCRVKDMRKPR